MYWLERLEYGNKQIRFTQSHEAKRRMFGVLTAPDASGHSVRALQNSKRNGRSLLYLEYRQASSVRVRPHQQLQANGSGHSEYSLTPKGRQQTPCFLFLLLISELKLRVGGVIMTAHFQFMIFCVSAPANKFWMRGARRQDERKRRALSLVLNFGRFYIGL